MSINQPSGVTHRGKPSRLVETAVLDSILSWQFLIAWAGEGNGELQRLGWWRTDLTDEAGGGDFFRRLLPKTWKWAAFEAVRAAAIQQDWDNRQQLAQPDLVNTLFFWGFDLDEQLADRLLAHKQSQRPLAEKLTLPLELSDKFDRAAFEAALDTFEQSVDYKVVPGGREIQAAGQRAGLPDYEVRSRTLAAALLPLSENYPMPFYRLETADAL